MCAILLYFFDNINGGVLGVSRARRNEIQKQKTEESS
jgi:hypothetical protein